MKYENFTHRCRFRSYRSIENLYWQNGKTKISFSAYSLWIWLQLMLDIDWFPSLFSPLQHRRRLFRILWYIKSIKFCDKIYSYVNWWWQRDNRQIVISLAHFVDFYLINNFHICFSIWFIYFILNVIKLKFEFYSKLNGIACWMNSNSSSTNKYNFLNEIISIRLNR